jgi:roadblock/LC7 domain-containing protein
MEEANMSTTLDDLVKMDGVIAAFEYMPDGECTGYRNVSPEMAAMIARFCATVTMLFNTLATSFTSLAETSWMPQQGWTYTGGNHTVILGGGGYRGVFVETAKANLPELLQALSG